MIDSKEKADAIEKLDELLGKNENHKYDAEISMLVAEVYDTAFNLGYSKGFANGANPLHTTVII